MALSRRREDDLRPQRRARQVLTGMVPGDTLRLRDGLNPVFIARSIWQHRDLVRQLTLREIRDRYSGAYLGVLWSLAQPLLRLGVYCFLFLMIFKPRAAAGTVTRGEFVAGLFCGLIIYRLFAETVSRSPNLVTSKRSFVKNVVFPLEVLPVVSLGASFLLFLGPLMILLIALVSLAHVPATIVLLPATLLPLLMLTLGLSWWLAALGVFVGDVSHAVRFVTQMLFFMSPIVWRVNLLPPAYRPYAMLNPLAVIIENTRAVAIHGQMPDWPQLAAVVVGAAALMGLGFVWFNRTKGGFGDVL